MEEINGSWVMQGLSPDDPGCIHTAGELADYIDEVGFLPLFAGEVPGFSVEEHTASASWWTGDEASDPWEWRAVLARSGRFAYGKFFRNKAGFISARWLPVFANYRRDGYDFDALWDDELATVRQKKIMDLFAGDKEDREMMTFEVRRAAGFGSGGEKNFEGTLTQLEMMCYLVIRDFRQRRNKAGREYGWPIAVLCTPEHLFGRELVTSTYAQEPKDSLEKIVQRVQQFYPDAGRTQILKTAALTKDRRSLQEKLTFPRNLLRKIDPKKDPWDWTPDQINGLYVAVGQVRTKHQRVLIDKYFYGMTNEEIGLEMNRAAGTVSTYNGKGLRRLRSPLVAAWYRDGYRANLKACAAGQNWTYPWYEPEDAVRPQDYCLRIGLKVSVFENMADAGILTVQDLEGAMQDAKWYRRVRGVGPKTAEEIRRKLEYFYPGEQTDE